VRNAVPTPQSPTIAQRAAASIVLGALLVQILLFYVGLLDPVRRTASVWGKNLEERRAVVWGPGAQLKSIAERFPPNARIYMLEPQQALPHWNGIYYFYPRILCCSMTNGAYRTNEDYARWNEWPSHEWLVKNNFTYTLDLKAGRVEQVTPPPSQVPNAR
jgi:hypothetical protein